VAVQFEGKPMPGAQVAIFSSNTVRPIASAITARDGTVRFRNLRPGKYYLNVDHLGISAAFDQIEVRDRVSAQAKARLDYRWGEWPAAVRQVSGNVMDIQRQGTTVFERLKNPPLEIPIAGAQIQLRHPTNGSVYAGASDENGEFALDGVPTGIYAAHVWGGVSANDSVKFLVQVIPTATRDSLQIIRTDMCGTGLYLRY
jgi:hypothetical protein